VMASFVDQSDCPDRFPDHLLYPVLDSGVLPWVDFGLGTWLANVVWWIVLVHLVSTYKARWSGLGTFLLRFGYFEGSD